MVITMYGQKGGGGKSTAATNLAAEGCRRRRKVAIVDLDPQGSATDWHDEATRRHEDNPRAPMPPILLPNLHVAGLAGFDLVVVDVPPKYDEHQGTALMAADLVVMPCAPSFPDIRALGKSLELLQQVLLRRPTLRAAILLSRVKSAATAKRGREALAASCLPATDEQEQGPLYTDLAPVLRAQLGDRLAYQDAMGCGQGVTTYTPKTSPASAEVQALYDELRVLGRTR